MLYELIYRSLGFKEMDTEDLESLLTTSRSRNISLGISSLLLYHNCEFLHVLEGERDTVTALYRRIIEDERHHLAHVISQGELGKRAFESYPMGFVNTRRQALELPETHQRFLDEGILVASRKSPSLCKPLLANLRDSLLLAPTLSSL